MFHVSDLFDIQKGTVAASEANSGEYPFITSAEEPKQHDSYGFEGEAICIPVVSVTGHGHASIKRIHYVNGQFAAATIVAVLSKKEKPKASVYVPYVYYFLLAHKDDVLVPLMRGAANVSLSLERLGALRIPLPALAEEQRKRVRALERRSQKLFEARLGVERAEKAFDVEFVRFAGTI